MSKVVCPVCETEFEKKINNQKFCSTKCRNRNDYASHPEQHKTKSAAYRKKHPERCRAYSLKQRTFHKDALAKNFRERHKRYREWIMGIKSSLKCSKCGESRPMCLDFHHLDGSRKEFNVGAMIGKHRPKELVLKEIAKCSVLCRNCHAIEHWEQGNG